MSYEGGYGAGGDNYGSGSDMTSGYGGMGGQSMGPRTNSVTPVTIKVIDTLMASEHDKAKIGEYELKLVTFIAYVLECDLEKRQCLVEDGTGIIFVQLQEDVEGALNNYLRFTGHLQWSKNAYAEYSLGKTEGPILRTYKVDPVTDHNEISFHLLDVITSYEKIKKASSSMGGVGTAGSGFSSDSMSGYQYPTSSSLGGESSEFAGAAETATDAVVEQFQKLGQMSLDLPTLVTELAGRLSEFEVQRACEELQSKGRLFTEDGTTYTFVE